MSQNNNDINPNSIKLYIVDPNSGFISKIEGLFFERPSIGISVIGSATTTSAFEKDKKIISTADAFLVSANLPDGTGIKIVEFLRNNSITAGKPILFTFDKATRNHITIAKQKGVDHSFQKPFKIQDLITKIKELAEKENVSNVSEEDATTSELKEKLNTAEPIKTEKIPKPIKPARKQQSPSSPLPKMLTEREEDDIFSKVDNNPLLNLQEDDEEPKASKAAPKKSIITFGAVSSTGKTSLLVNTAYAIAKYSKVKPKICIVDLNLLFPSVMFHFKNSELKLATRDIYDVSADINYLSEELLSEALSVHEPTGISILNTPSEPEFIHKVGLLKSEQLERIFVHLRDMFDLILVDTSNAITEDQVLFPMQFSDKNIVVLEPNYLNVVGVNKFFYVLKKLEDSIKEPIISKTDLILNKESKNKSIYSDTVRDFLYDKKFVTRIPEDNKFVDFANKGAFIVDSDSIASSTIIDLANHLYPIHPSKEKNKFALKKIFKK